MTKEQIAVELKAIIIYCNAVRCDNNRGRMKLLVRDDIQPRAQKILNYLEGLE
jgi:hypothetical protein